ncbi:PepSY domain-containing protein [Bradyrhizobium sp. DOA9]|uniref:PepSY domain-containing protein n=1 Tax=Bradyrhizobium sp. DOA9 TaxID=1126627 RepID=UPI0005A68FAB|nr:PepSY domain-containing protein [Bradyrhizobium sp. DOA9]
MPLLAGVLLAAAPAAAGDRDRAPPDAVRRAVEAGEIKSLADILASLSGKLPGQVAGVEIERVRGRWIYEFRIVGDRGRLFEAYVDARSGEIERIKEK